MKIFYTIHQFFPIYYTGTERYLLNLSTMMLKLGHQIKIATYQPQKTSDLQRQGNILYKRYFYCGIEVIAIHYDGDQSYISFDYHNDEIKNFLKNEIKKFNPDIIHVAHPMRLTPVFEIAEELKKNIIITLTDYWLLCGKGILIKNNQQLCINNHNGLDCYKYCYTHLKKQRLISRMTETKRYLSNVSATIYSADFLRKVFEENNILLKNPYLIRHGFNYVENFKPINKKKKEKENNVFIFSALGSLTEHKGAALLINAFKKCQNKNFRLHIYGDAYDEKYELLLKNMANDDKRILFKGKYTFSQLKSIHEEADVIVISSVWFETYPLVGVAALAYGVPIIVPDLSGAAELISDFNGSVFKINDQESLTDVMINIAEKNLKYQERIFYPYFIETEAIETEKIYQKIIKL